MTTSTKSTDTTTGSGRGSARAVKLTFPRVLVSEWIKVRSVLSSVGALVALVLAVIGGAAYSAVGIVVSDSTSAAEAVAADPTGGYLSGIALAQLVAIVFGVIAVTGEYRSTMIRSSLAAVPTRLPLLWGKAAVAATVTAVVALAALLPAFFVAGAIVAIANVSLAPTIPSLATTMIGSALLLGITAAWAVGCGWLLRNTAAAIFALLGVLYILPSLAGFLPQSVIQIVGPFLPNYAVAAVTRAAPVEGALPPWLGLLVYAGYAVITLAAAALLLQRRDA
jgi:ABC-2 type transport system permease protein